MQHKTCAAGTWHTMTLAEQMGNIGSEVHRALKWQGKDNAQFEAACERALELFDLSLEDVRWRRSVSRGTGRGCLREIARAREVFCDAILGGKEYKSSLEDLDRYFFLFALAARKHVY